jgi:pimeloyl-ACP methyl ester carboxylesterase
MRGKVADPAWKSKPTWYIVDGNDRATSPGLEASLAKKIGATTITVPSSHVIMLSKPRRVADVFLGAASTVNPK